MNRCPVCMYPNLPYLAADYHICPCCGTEFGNDDAYQSHNALREAWLHQGAPWFFGNPPTGWNATQQLLDGGLNYSRPISNERTITFSFKPVGNLVVEIKDAADRTEYAVAV